MYTEFYNLKEKPFNLTPSSRFLYLGDIHKEALALLTYGVVERKGFILLTGEVGTGKTTMVNALLANLGEDVQCVYLSNPLFSVKDFMDYLAFSAFKKKIFYRSKADFLIHFQDYLKVQLQHQKNFILIIDEAQKLSFDLLEEIRLLSNMETADEKLINIFLVGQPELNETLSRPECRPLLQRISIRYHIKPLDQEGTREYISTRLRMAGAENGDRIIPKNVAGAIYQYSDGYPRMINILADNALLLGYSRGEKKITPSMVKESYEDLQLEGSFFETGPPKKDAPEVKKRETARKGHRWKWAAALIFILALIGFIISPQGKTFLFRLTAFFSRSENAEPGIMNHQTVPEEKIIDKEIPGAPASLDNNTEGRISQKKESESGVEKEVGEGVFEKENRSDDTNILMGENETILSGITPVEDMDQIPEVSNETWERILVVKEGETLTELATNVYGYANDDMLKLIKENNPEIEDINHIEIGQEIYFPRLNITDNGETYTVHIASFGPFENAQKLFNELTNKGYEAYLLPVYNTQKGKIFRVTLGNFESYRRAQEYASQIIEKGVSDYATAIRLEMR